MPCFAGSTLYSIQLNGQPGITFYGSALTGADEDVWNNPDWVGVPSGSTTLFSDVSLVDSKGNAGRVKATLTAAYNTNANDWNGGGIFNHYVGRDDGDATPGLMDLVVKVDYNGSEVDGMTLTLSGLPKNTQVTVYAYGAGQNAGAGSVWSLAEANGGVSATILYDGTSAAGRDVRLESSKGLSWETISGKTDGDGNLTIVASAPPKGSSDTIWWQTYINGCRYRWFRASRGLLGRPSACKGGLFVLFYPSVPC